MLCPICKNELNQNNGYRCSRFPVCTYQYVEAKNFDDSSYIVFDFETTGRSHQKDTIIEIGAVKVKEGKVVDTFDMLINPGLDEFGNQIYVSEFITNLTKIDNAMLEDKPYLNEALQSFIEFIGEEKTCSGQNILSFDIPFLRAACTKCQVEFPFVRYFDTLKIARDQLQLKKKGLVENNSQTSLAAYYGFEYNAHRAEDDAKASYRILENMKEEAKRLGLSIQSSQIEKGRQKCAVLPNKSVHGTVSL